MPHREGNLEYNVYIWAETDLISLREEMRNLTENYYDENMDRTRERYCIASTQSNSILLSHIKLLPIRANRPHRNAGLDLT
jgi:hypothetical protein